MKITLIVTFFLATFSLSTLGDEVILEVPQQITIDFSADFITLENLSKKMDSIDKNPELKSSNATLLEKYEIISKEWREIYKMQNDGISLVVDDGIPVDKLSAEQKNELNRLRELKKQILSKVERLFYLVSRKRSQAIKLIFDSGQSSEIKLDKIFLTDLSLEVKTIPLRWLSLFKSRYQKVKNDLSAGLDGWVSILKELSAVFVVFILGLVSYRLFKKFSLYLTGVRDVYSKKAYRDKKARLISRWLGRITPLLPWIWTVIFFEFSERIIADGYFREIIIIFPYFTYYAFYRIFRIIIKQLISSYLFFKYDHSFQLDKKKLDWTSKVLGNVFLGVMIIQHTLKSAGGEGFLYSWISSLFYYFLVFIVFFVSDKWRPEIKLVAQKYFSGSTLNVLNMGLDSKFHILFCPPIFILEILFHFLFALYSFLERFDLVRAISAQYFRKKVESAKQDDVVSEEDKELPLKYLEGFYSIEESVFPLQKSQQLIHDSLMINLNKWIEEKSDEHISLVYGEKGIGKTFLLNRVQASITEVEKLYYNLDNRISQKEQLNQIISELRPKKDKMVVFIDGLQYLFLSKRNGFEYFKEFLKMTQEEHLNHIFWCLGINNYSWEFLESVLNKNRYFNFIYKVDRWREEDLQSLIIKKHQATGFELTYDDVLYSANRTGEGEEFDIEGRYFRILWEEAMGNPSVAQKIWLASISQAKDQEMLASLPVEQTEFLGDLPDEFYFVLATIVRHESLDIQEILESTNLSEDIVRNSVKNCLEKGYLVKRKNSKVSISLISQHAVYSTLKRMNFIYG